MILKRLPHRILAKYINNAKEEVLHAIHRPYLVMIQHLVLLGIISNHLPLLQRLVLDIGYADQQAVLDDIVCGEELSVLEDLGVDSRYYKL